MNAKQLFKTMSQSLAALAMTLLLAVPGFAANTTELEANATIEANIAFNQQRAMEYGTIIPDILSNTSTTHTMTTAGAITSSSTNGGVGHVLNPTGLFGILNANNFTGNVTLTTPDPATCTVGGLTSTSVTFDTLVFQRDGLGNGATFELTGANTVNVGANLNVGNTDQQTDLASDAAVFCTMGILLTLN